MTPQAHSAARGNASDVVVTGAGLVTALGLDLPTTWAGILRGQCGIAPLTVVESPLSPNKGGGEAPPLSDIDSKDALRESTYLHRAMAEALRAAGWDESQPRKSLRRGVLMGTTLHGMRQAGRFLRADDVTFLGHFLAGSVLRTALAGLGPFDLATTVCSACSSGLAGIALGATLLRTGAIDMAIAGGYDPISEYAYGGFNAMRLIADGPLRPFALGRKGMKLGEGYGVVVLERRSGAQARGAEVLATIAAYGESCDAFHLSKPHPEGEGAAVAMHAALQRAGIDPREIGLIAAHATGTPENDAAEYAAMKREFGPLLVDIPVVTFKTHLGHTLGGAGAVELILSLMALRRQTLPACATSNRGVPEFSPLRLLADKPQTATFDHVLNTSLGFGGANTCMILSRERAPRETPAPTGAALLPQPDSPNDVLITGIGVLLPGLTGNAEFVAHLCRPDPQPLDNDTGGLENIDADHIAAARRARRVSDYVKLALGATSLALEDAHVDDVPAYAENCAAILGTTHGSTAYCERYYRQIVEQGIDAANPLLFAEGVPNAAAAHLSTNLSLKGFCQTVIGTRTAGLEALNLAAARILTGDWHRALVNAADEHSTLVNRAYRHYGLMATPPQQPRTHGVRAAVADRRPGFYTGCGAVTFVLESRASAEARGARIYGRIVATATGYDTRMTSHHGLAAARRVYRAIGGSEFLLTASNGTWLDGIERLALRRTSPAGDSAAASSPCVSSLYGHIAECFSATPLAAIAAVLLTGRFPKWLGPTSKHFRAARGDEHPSQFGVLAADYAGTICGCCIDRPTAPQHG